MIKPEDVLVFAPYESSPHNFDADTVSDEPLSDAMVAQLNGVLLNIDAGLTSKATHTQTLQGSDSNRLVKAVHRIYTEAGWDVRVEMTPDKIRKFHFHVYIQRLVLDDKFTEFLKTRNDSVMTRGRCECAWLAPSSFAS